MFWRADMPICQLSLQGLITARTEIQRVNKFALEEVVPVRARSDGSRSSSPGAQRIANTECPIVVEANVC